MGTKVSNKTEKELKEELKRQEEEKQTRRQKKRERPPLNNALIVSQHEGFYLTHVDEEAPGQYGRRWRYGNLWVFLLQKKREVIEPKGDGDSPTTLETLVPIEIPKKLGQLPDKLYRALFWKEGEILFSLRNTLLEKLNTFSVYILIGILLFFIYLMYNSL